MDRYLYLAKTNNKNIDNKCSQFQRKKFSSSQHISNHYKHEFKKLMNQQINKKGNKFMMSSIKEVVIYELPISHETIDNQTYVYIEALNFKALQPLTEHDTDLISQAMLNHVLDYVETHQLEADEYHVIADNPLALRLLEVVEAALQVLAEHA